MGPASIIIPIVITLLVLLVGGFIFMWVFCMKIAKKQYTNMFIRESKDKWARGNSAPENAEHTVMFNTGMTWGEENASYMKEIEMTSFDGLKMKGEYFDFGNDKACLIMAGRASTATISRISIRRTSSTLSLLTPEQRA